MDNLFSFIGILMLNILTCSIKCEVPITLSPCGDWIPYKGEKCYNILEKLGSEKEAISACSQFSEDTTLITILSNDEQEFLNNILAKYVNISAGVWIGVVFNSSGASKWIDGSDVKYQNWQQGSPEDRVPVHCGQMSLIKTNIGKWTDDPCTRPSLIACQRRQIWTVALLHDAVEKVTRQLQDRFQSELEEQINNVNYDLDEYLFSNKVASYITFADDNHVRKALIFPIQNLTSYTHEEATNICLANNASLVEIESLNKQLIVQTFINQFTGLVGFWTGGTRDGTGTFRWINNGNALKYTNWKAGYPVATVGANFVYIALARASPFTDINFGLWYNVDVAGKFSVICEIAFQ